MGLRRPFPRPTLSAGGGDVQYELKKRRELRVPTAAAGRRIEVGEDNDSFEFKDGVTKNTWYPEDVRFLNLTRQPETPHVH